MLRVTGGASGGKRARSERAPDFSCKPDDPEVVKAALLMQPLELQPFIANLTAAEFKDLYDYTMEQKSMERVLEKISAQMQVLRDIEDTTK